MAAGIAVGRDCVMDGPWYSWAAPTCSSGRDGACVGRMTSQAAMKCFDAVTVNRRASWASPGLRPRAPAYAMRDFVLLQARESKPLRLRAARLAVVRAGRCIIALASGISAPEPAWPGRDRVHAASSRRHLGHPRARTHVRPSLPPPGAAPMASACRHSLMELARIGATPRAGWCRLALTDLDRQGRDRVVAWGRAGRSRRSRGPHRQCLHAPCQARQPGAAAGGSRQPHRHPAHRRQVLRRQLRRAGRPGGGAHAERPRHVQTEGRRRGWPSGPTRKARASCAGDDGFGRVRRAFPWHMPMHRKGRGRTRTVQDELERIGRLASSVQERIRWAAARDPSSRGRCSSEHEATIGESPACWASADTRLHRHRRMDARQTA